MESRKESSPGSRISRAGSALWLLALLTFALWSRAPLRHDGLWRDEALSVFISRANSLPELIRRNAVADYNPPLFNLMLSGWGRAVGFGESPLENFATVWGLLAWAACGLLAYEIGGGISAGVAAALAVNNPILVRMSGELRPYSLSAFLCLLSLAIAVRHVSGRRIGGRGLPLLLLPCLVLLVYAHVAGGIVTAILFAWGVFRWARGTDSVTGKRIAICALAAGGAFLLWAPVTWRQFRVGIPYERSMGLVENLKSLLRRSREAMPISGGFEDPLVLLGVLLLAISAVSARAALVRILRQRRVGLLLAGLAGVSVWLILGLFSVEARYLTVPAALFAVLGGCVVGGLFDAARGGSSLARATAVLGVLCIVLGTFSSRLDFYSELSASRSRPKSGVRTLCQSPRLRSSNLLVVAPDYLASTVWYYCGARKDLKGFVRWTDPVSAESQGLFSALEFADGSRRLSLRVERGSCREEGISL